MCLLNKVFLFVEVVNRVVVLTIILKDLMIFLGCHINNIDEDGNSALHLSLLKHSAPCFSGDSSSEIASVSIFFMRK